MSPSVVGMASVTFRPFVNSKRSFKSIYASLNGKYVGRQYYDNTSSSERSIPAYFVSDISLGYQLSSLSVSLHISNLFNRMYYADAWLWRAYFQQEDSYYTDTGIYPQAPINWMLKVAWKFWWDTLCHHARDTLCHVFHCEARHFRERTRHEAGEYTRPACFVLVQSNP